MALTMDQMLSLEFITPEIKADVTKKTQNRAEGQASGSAGPVSNEANTSGSQVKTPNKNKIKKKVMGSQARELIAMVYEFMKNEANQGVMNLTDARWRTSQATGVSEKTVTRILKEKKKADATGSPIRSPHRNKKPRKSLKRDISEEDKNIIRYTINNFQREFNKPPTLQGLKEVLKDRINFNGCNETLRRLLLAIGYGFKATRTLSARHEKLVEKKIKVDTSTAADAFFLSNYDGLTPEDSAV